MRRVRLGALIGALVLASAGPAAAPLVDAVVGTVDSTTVSASDIALARALSLFGFTPSETPIRSADIDRYGAALVGALEAGRLGIGPTREELDHAWTELQARIGGAAALSAWLSATAINDAWARRSLDAHLRWHRWRTLHEGFTAETPGGGPAAPESDLVVRNLLSPEQTIAVPFAMPARVAP